MKNSSPSAFVMSLTSGFIQLFVFGSLAEATTTFTTLARNDSASQSFTSSLARNDSISHSFTSSLSSTSSTFPNFIRPSVNPTAECNLWGLLCQTGLIEVGVNMTTTITTTTVPCSYYLSAQAESARPGFLTDGVAAYFRPEAGYLSSFGHSPECSVYADDRKAPHPLVPPSVPPSVRSSESDALYSAVHFSQCGPRGRFEDWREYVPPGVSMTHMGGPFNDFYCCGACTLKIHEIRLMYFPASSTYSCSRDTANITSPYSLTSNHNRLDKRIQSLLNNESTLITDGHTLTSPSFYLQMVGTASMQDSCGQVGSVYTNAIVPVPRDGLSTISLNLSIGETFMNRDYWRANIASYTKQVRLEDLACPTWGLMNAETDGNYVTVGSPFFPIIHPPSELLSFDPAWGKCTEYVTAERAGGFLPYEVFDPPRILVPASALAPATNPVNIVTSSDPSQTTEAPPKANPADLRSSELPSITKRPLSSDLGQRSTRTVERTSAEIFHAAPAANSKNSDPKESKQRPGLNTPSGVDPEAGDPTLPSESIGGHNQPVSPGIGALIFSAFGAPRVPKPSVKGSGEGAAASSTLDSRLIVLAEDVSTFTAMPSAVPIDGSTVSQTELANQIVGTSMSMKKSGEIRSGGIDSAKFDKGGNGYFTFAGQVFTTYLSGLLVDGFTLIPNGVDISRSGTVINLDSAGNLRVDKSTVKIVNFDPTSPPSRYSINGQLDRGNPSYLIMDDKTIKPGGAGITVSGTFLRLDPDGNLEVDASTLRLETFLPTPLASVYTVNGQIVTGNPSILAVGGKTMTPGGTPVIVSGTSLRLDSDGALVVDASTLNLASFLPSPLPSVYTVNGQLLTGDPSLLAVGGKTMTAGGAPITISGTPVRLESSGVLRFGTQDIPFATGDGSHGGNGTVSPEAFLSGHERVQARKKNTMRLGLLMVGIYMAVA